uniref:DUF4283 domain-containing protein n=1 Tax=Brassica oleracea TaxID=3712 RepID=A0A3P6GP94_BRAOL|nr:unnamed protein product [Brassica oleracea]
MDEEIPDPQTNLPILDPKPQDEASVPISPDPRWPYLGKWSAIPPTGATSVPAKDEIHSNPPETEDISSSVSKKRHLVICVSSDDDSSSASLAKITTLGDLNTSSVVNAVAAVGGMDTSTDSTIKLKDGDHRSSCTTESVSPHHLAGLSPIKVPSPEVSCDPPITTFVPSIGAWAKPLAFAPPATPPTPSTPSDFDPKYLNNLLNSFWPTLADGTGQSQKKKDQPPAVREFPRIPVKKIPVPELKDDGTLRFPWAARMDPSARNLYRAAKPTFRLDGTPEVAIPSQVLLLGPENKKEYIIGQFHRCSLPPGGLIHAVVNRLWGRSCRIGCRKLSESSYMFHIPHESTRQWVIQRGVWHVDDCMLFVSPWKSVNSFKVPEVSTIPVWVNLKNVPDSCYSRLGLSHVASGLGEPMQTHKPRLDPTCLGEAKLLVEVELDKTFPKQIALDDKQGNIFLVDVEYTWIPSVCGRCGHLGHKEKRCLLPANQKNVEIGSSHEDLLAKETRIGMDKVQAQSTVASDQLEMQVENSELSLVTAQEAQAEHTLQTLVPTKASETEHLSQGVDPKEFSTPVNNSTHSKQSIATGSNSQTTSPPLTGTISAPTQTNIMEEIPSHVIVFKTNSVSADNPLVSTHSPAHGSPLFNQTDHYEQDDRDGIMSDATANLNMSRGGRPIKPLQKFQDMEWSTVRGKSNRGRRGRGNHRPST